MSVSRRSAGPVRQLSLQSSASSSHRPLRRQHSEEHHQERWRRRGASPELCVTANSLRTGGPVPQDPGLSPAAGHYPVLARPPPRPVKLAWGERRGAAAGSDRQGVEVVAKKCLGNPRPVTAKHAANNLPTLGLDAVMYTRQQLAERLRKAWREREKSRPNLDIFLSHVTSEDCLQDTPRNTPVISVLAKPRVNLAPSGGGVGVDLEPVGAATNFSVFPSGAQISQASYVTDRSSCAVAEDTSPMDPDIAPDSSSNYDGDDRESLIISRQIVIAVSPRPNTAPVGRKTDGKTNPAPKDCVGPIPQKSPNEHGQGEGPGKSYEEMSAGARRFSFKNSASKAIMESFTSDSPPSPTPPPAVRPTSTIIPAVRTTPTPPPAFRPAPTPPLAFRPTPTPPPAIRPAPTPPPVGRPAPTPPPAVRPAPTQPPAVRPASTPPPSTRPVPAPPPSARPVPTPPPTVRSVPTPPPVIRPAPTPPLISRAVPTPPLLRALSAPAQRSPTPRGILAVVGSVRQQPLQAAVSVDLEDSVVGEEEENPWSRDRNIRSAPPRRPRLKTVSGRKKPRGRGEEENDEEAGADKREKGAGGGRRGVHRGSEIITMVSLMSPGGSDNEADGDAFFQSTTSSNVPSWFEDRNAGKSVGDIAAALTTAVTRVVCLRKTPKSVSFQQVLPLAVAAVVSVPPSIPAAAPPHHPSPGPQERDKRAPSGTRDEEDGSAKRKVVRIQSAPVVKQNCSVEEEHQPSKEEDLKVSNKPKVLEKTRAPADEPKVPEKTRAPTEQAEQPPPVSNLARPDPVSSTEPASVPSEPSLGQLGVESLVVPEFKSPKEKECWELYRRMCDKGVTVSYDTVLRGMLTPTEYRLRRNALLSTCG